MQTATFKTLLSSPAHFVAMGFGTGLVPKIPGTCGALLAIVLYGLLVPLPLPLYLVVVAAVTLVGILAAGKSARLLGVRDPNVIVIDEIAGMLIGLTAIPDGWVWLAIAFGVFRFLDVVKPWPICVFDRHGSGGLGIVLDDVAAGVMTFVVVQLLAQSGFLASIG